MTHHLSIYVNPCVMLLICIPSDIVSTVNWFSLHNLCWPKEKAYTTCVNFVCTSLFQFSVDSMNWFLVTVFCCCLHSSLFLGGCVMVWERGCSRVFQIAMLLGRNDMKRITLQLDSFCLVYLVMEPRHKCGQFGSA